MAQDKPVKTKRRRRRRGQAVPSGIAGIHIVRPDGTEVDLMDLANALAETWSGPPGLKFSLALGRRLRIAPWHVTEIINRLVIAGGLNSK